MRSARLCYEPLTAAHAPLLYPVLAPPEVWTHITGSDETTLEGMTARYARIERGAPPERVGERWLNFAARLAADGDWCGRIEATIHVADGWAEIAYVLGPAFWGRGLATEAVGWLCAHLREAHDVGGIYAATHPDNLASERVLARVGFVAAPATRPVLLSEDPGDKVWAFTRS